MGEFQGEKSLLTKNNTKGLSDICKRYLDDAQDFWKNTLWTNETEVEPFGMKLTWHFI